MSLRDLFMCVFSVPGSKLPRYSQKSLWDFPCVKNDVQDYAAPKVHHPVLECPPSEPESVSGEPYPRCLDTFPRCKRGPTRQPFGGIFLEIKNYYGNGRMFQPLVGREHHPVLECSDEGGTYRENRGLCCLDTIPLTAGHSATG